MLRKKVFSSTARLVHGVCSPPGSRAPQPCLRIPHPGRSFRRFPKAYPGSIQAVEGYARVVATGGTAKPDIDGALVVKGADRIMLFVDIRLLHDSDC